VLSCARTIAIAGVAASILASVRVDAMSEPANEDLRNTRAPRRAVTADWRMSSWPQETPSPVQSFASFVRQDASAFVYYLSLNENRFSDTERSACVSVALAEGAAFECGDLRVTYDLPAIRYRSQTRNPTLIYNSQHAKPNPIVTINTGTPYCSVSGEIAVSATLSSEGGIRAQRRWTVSELGGSARNKLLQLSFDASDLPTGLYQFSVSLSYEFPTTSCSVSSRAGEIAIVNRANSEFGAGWWLAGYERLQRTGINYSIPFTTDNDLFWVGGDGSTRRYMYKYVAPSGVKVYRANNLAGVDSLTEWPDGSFRRHLTRGAYVHFAASGRHDATVSDVGQVTSFVSNACGRLDQLWLTPTSQPATGRYWNFQYNTGSSCTGTPTLTSVRPVSGETPNDVSRVTTRTVTATSGSFTHSYLNSVLLSHSDSAGRINRVTDARGTTTIIDYGVAGLVERATTVVGGPASNNIVRRLRAAEGAAVTVPLPADSVYTAIYSPRTAVTTATKIWIARFGNPREILDPLGRRTSIAYNGPPLLPNRVTSPSGYSNYAMYNDDGKLIYRNADAINGQYPEWYYRYNDPAYPDNMTSTTDVTGVTTTYEYQAIAAGMYPMLSAQQTGADPLARVGFAYYDSAQPQTFGLPRATLSGANEQGTRSRDSLGYDAQGNLNLALSAGGKRTEYSNDIIGRTVQARTLIFRPTVGSTIINPDDPPPPPPPGGGGGGSIWPPWSTEKWLVENTDYDPLDRVTTTLTIAPEDLSRNIAEQRVFTQTTYLGSTGLARSVFRSPYDGATLTDSTSYDALGRPYVRWAQGFTAAESLFYDAAGNISRRRTPRGHNITMQYDALDRLTMRATPTVSAAIPLDTAKFTYDVLTGALETASNGDSFVRKEYTINGWQRYERQEQRTETGSIVSAHSYVTQYEYDIAGRRIKLTHPWQAAVGVGAFTTYGYDSNDGALQTVTDPSGSAVSFAYDPRGQLKTLTRPGNVVQRMRYTSDGELSLDSIMLNGATVRSTGLWYDPRGKLIRSLNGTGPHDDLSVSYSPIGHVWFSVFSGSGSGVIGGTVTSGNTESYTHDALGSIKGGTFARAVGDNTNSNSSSAQRSYVYDSLGRLATMTDDWQNVYTYDAAGNQTASTGSGGPSTTRTDTYNALNQLVQSKSQTGKQPTARTITTTNMRYDALGRRIWIKKASSCTGTPEDTSLFCRTTYLRRTAWDGSQELAEWQGWEEDEGKRGCTTPRPMLSGLPSEDECPLWGQSLYIHGGALDAPLGVVRSNYSEYQWANSQWVLRTFPTFVMYPHWTSRGEPDLATTGSGNVTPCANGSWAPPCAQNFGWPAGMTPYMQQPA
jgi:YD repeat-containing protein